MQKDTRLTCGLPLLIGCAFTSACAFGGRESPEDRRPTDEDGDGEDPGTNPTSGEGCAKMDVVFVIDNSESMTSEQASVYQNLPQFVSVLDNYRVDDQPLDYRIAVTTTDCDSYTLISEIPDPFNPTKWITTENHMKGGEDGAFQTRKFPDISDPGEDCGMTRAWLERGDPNLLEKLNCIGHVGNYGAGFEMPLWAMKQAFTDRVQDGANAGFLRSDALLTVVIISDEDDCSNENDPIYQGFEEGSVCTTAGSHPPADYVRFLDELTGARDRWAAAVIAAPENCHGPFGDAEEAIRLKSFVEASDGSAVFSTICTDDLGPAFKAALDRFDVACQDYPGGVE